MFKSTEHKSIHCKERGFYEGDSDNIRSVQTRGKSIIIILEKKIVNKVKGNPHGNVYIATSRDHDYF